MNFANWSEITFVNGTTPAINAVNLNAIESSLTGVMNELNYSNGFNFKQYLDYAIENGTLDIKAFNNYIEWGTHGTCTRANEYTTILLNDVGIKVTESDNTGGVVGISDTFSSVNCEEYPSGSPAGTDDYISMIFYVSDATKISNVVFRIGTDASNYYYLTSGRNTGWNVRIASKSGFATTGSPAGWDNITYIQLYYTTANNSQGEYIIYNSLKMIRANLTDFTLNPFYMNDGTASPPVASDYTIEKHITSTCDSITYYDEKLHKKGMLYGYTSPFGAFEILCTVNSFSFRCEVYAKSDDNVMSLKWQIDANNYITVDIKDSNLYINETVAGTLTEVVESLLDDYINFHDRMELWVDKTQDNILRVRLSVDGQKPVYAEWETSFSSTSAGCVSINTPANESYYFITEFVVAHNQNSLPAFMGEGLTLYKRKLQSESRTSTTSSTADTELWLNLPSNSLFEIELQLSISGALAGDFKSNWSYNGTIAQETKRSIIGLSHSITTTQSAGGLMRATTSNITTSIQCGCDDTVSVPLLEKFVIWTGKEGGKLSLLWSQYASSATSTTLDTSSYIKATKIS
jgi:hypothetical protein